METLTSSLNDKSDEVATLEGTIQEKDVALVALQQINLDEQDMLEEPKGELLLIQQLLTSAQEERDNLGRTLQASMSELTDVRRLLARSRRRELDTKNRLSTASALDGLRQKDDEIEELVNKVRNLESLIFKLNQNCSAEADIVGQGTEDRGQSSHSAGMNQLQADLNDAHVRIKGLERMNNRLLEERHILNAESRGLC